MTDWKDFERIRDLPDVDAALFGFKEDPTGDNATCIVRAVLTAAAPKPRTDQDIVDQTEGLARHLASMEGYELNGRFYENFASPRAWKYWRMAERAQELLTDTDVQNALDSIQPLVIKDKWKRHCLRHFVQRHNGDAAIIFDALVDAPENAEPTFNAFQCSFTDECINRELVDVVADMISMAETLQRLENEE